MIAIGILGVGMLMVAATFPVGLDQSRIVTEETIAPLVAEDAFTTLELLLNDKSSMKRIGNNIPVTDFPAVYSFRESLSHLPEPPNNFLTNVLPSAAPSNYFLLINDWLTAPYNSDIAKGEYGAHTRYFPSIPAIFKRSIARHNQDAQVADPLASTPTLYTYRIPQEYKGATESIDPPYTWSVLMRKVAHTSMGECIQFVVFVNRRSWQTPVINDGSILHNALGLGSLNNSVRFPVENAYINISDVEFEGIKAQPTMFNEGGYMVRAEDAKIFRIKSIDTTTNPNTPYLILNGNARLHTPINHPNTEPLDFWFIPADPNTGRSPCIGVYSRTFRLPYRQKTK